MIDRRIKKLLKIISYFVVNVCEKEAYVKFSFISIKFQVVIWKLILCYCIHYIKNSYNIFYNVSFNSNRETLVSLIYIYVHLVLSLPQILLEPVVHFYMSAIFLNIS